MRPRRRCRAGSTRWSAPDWRPRLAPGQAAARRSPQALRARSRLIKIVPIESAGSLPVDCHVVIGQVIGVHIEDRFIVDGLLDTAAMKPTARCGYDQYAVVQEVFAMTRPTA